MAGLSDIQANLGVEISFLDGADAPAAVAAHHTVGSFYSTADIRAFVAENKLDVLTVEIEHINVDALQEATAELGVSVQPTVATLRLIQDKYVQKLHFAACDIRVADFLEVSSPEAADKAGVELGFPFMLKSKRHAYDGRGNALVRAKEGIADAVASVGGYGHGLYAERLAPFIMEVSVMVARSVTGEVVTYPLTQTIHKDSILHATVTPAHVPPSVAEAAYHTAGAAVASLPGAGIFGVEMFVLPDGTVLVNEVAPRPHNSGHYTMDACATSQFEQVLRAVLGWPLGPPEMRVPSAVMFNILGDSNGESETGRILANTVSTPGARLHWYGKEFREGRKLGHVNFVGDTRASVWAGLDAVAGTMSPAQELAKREAQLRRALLGPLPPVAIIMGSDSDLPTMAPAAEILRELGIGCEVTVVSAHRTPERMVDFAKSAHLRGAKVIIAGAGGAAHLPGMVAAMTPLPVVGVPVKPEGACLDGMDALLSIAQMPRGVPVATVAIGNATNAGLLAARILGTSDDEVSRRVQLFASTQQATVLEKAARLESVGWQAYLEKQQ